jgi:hypothetical protein
MTTWLWMGWKTLRCCKFTGIPLLIASLQANSKDERSLPCKPLHLWQSWGLASGCAANVAGFSLHAGVMSNAQDRGKLERLCRYITRSGVSEKRLAITTFGKVRFQLKTPYRDGTTGDRRSHVIFEPLDFIARLAALVTKPRVNLARFHGVFVRGGPPPNSRHRVTITPALRNKTKQALPTG